MTTPRLCVTVAAAELDDLRRQRDAAHTVADIVELRLDALRSPDVAGALAGRGGPVLVTCRASWEGGWFDGPEETRLGLLDEAVGRGADYVDVEWRAAHAPLVAKRRGRGIVLSSHDFSSVPPDLTDRYRAMRASGAEVVKLAVRAERLADCLALRALGDLARQDRQAAALVGMGMPGAVTRLLPGHFGSCWSYSGAAVAPGQLEPGVMLGTFRFRAVSSRTRLYGVAGKPIGHSLSPVMHNAAFRACGLDAVYLPLEAADARDLLSFADTLAFEGLSVTAPFKQALLGAAGELDGVSRQVGALNTLRRHDGGWYGRNTDVAGFLAPLRGVELAGARAAVLGSGGAARSVVAALVSVGAEVTVYGRDERRAAEAASVGQGAAGRAGLPDRGSWDLLVNTTPVGTSPDVDATPIDAGRLGGGLVYDLVYNPATTRLLREAEAAGCRTLGGLDMLVAQAALQFEWWTGREAPVALMREAARDRLTTMAGAQ